VTYADIDAAIPRATQDGEQIHTELVEAEPTLDPQIATPLEDPSKPGRPAGKLFGRSLIDDLESRKASMRTKQRVFQGDDRPSMMARSRSSTLIDPATLQAPLGTQARPVSRHMSSLGSPNSQALGRRDSANAKPLLNFDDDKVPNLNARVPQTRSVFGVDTLWEREIVKLRAIEAKEKLEEEARLARELEEAARENKKRAKKGKRKTRQPPEEEPSPELIPSASQITQENPTLDNQTNVISSDPPVLPAIPKAPRRPPPVVADDESESDDSGLPGPSRTAGASSSAPQGWVSSDDEDVGPTRTTGVGPRFRTKSREIPPAPAKNEDSDNEDLPLSVTLGRAAQKAKAIQSASDSDDETQPLSTLLQKTKLGLPPFNFDNVSGSNHKDNDDEDDRPLGLRASRVAPLHQTLSTEGGGDDDMPLAFHPEQQRRSQHHMMAQQQQFLMQAQLQNNMFFSPQSMMMNGSGFFAPPMTVQPPMPMPSPPIIHDAAKYGRVDRWRHDVAVEGQ